ncbi:septation protein SepH [Nocardioides coralli]|uniref:septation protein SepH n=1 Tax=Nocardioides coralli TaxID=2872154 RepID=UPI001CA3A327|nr:septation protein SepH [Nocardioides coralli]QZY27851.1 DUF3071 domain-containing protein [Nocardioides coralli]
MAHLTLAGISDDGKRLLLVSDKGVEFTLDVDQRLRAALRGEKARLGQLEIKMDSALRPRDIQARIRAGETPEAVAQAAHTTVEAIMPFAAPVIAERQHVADRAQRSSVRRTGGQPGGARTLGEAVSAHLRGRNVDPELVEWDSARREDGKWSLTADFAAGARSGTARFTFDAPGNYVVAENDDATWLVGDAATEPEPPTAEDDFTRARARRAAAQGVDSELPLGDDALSLVQDEPTELGSEQPVEAYVDSDRPTTEVPDTGAASGDPEESAAPPSDLEEGGEDAEEPVRRRPAKKRGRASVPSWDEIMFGGGKAD